MKAELVLIPLIYRGHFPAALELAKLLVSRKDNLSITVLLLNLPNDPKLAEYNHSLVASFSSDQIKFVHVDSDPDPDSDSDVSESNDLRSCVKLIERHRSGVRRAVVARPGVSGLVLDMVCMAISDVATELGIPFYAFWASSASFLQVSGQSVDSTAEEHLFPGFEKPVPRAVLPSILLDSNASVISDWIERIRGSRGVIVNSSEEIEPRALVKPSSVIVLPPVYAVGPILHFPLTVQLTGEIEKNSIMTWLDLQPCESVLFLCFGSLGVSFNENQLKEIAAALESSDVRFLWSDKRFESPEKILPKEFSERTKRRGRVTGWAPQLEVLGHMAVGAFVSHCGWNSVLESLWHGVPVATWPLYAEQQLNAFAMVEEMALAVEVRMDFKCGGEAEMVRAKTIEAAIRAVMEGETSSEIRKRVKEMSVKCRAALAQGGSSFSSLDRFLTDVIENLNVD